MRKEARIQYINQQQKTMFVENNIYKTGSRSGNITRGGISGLSSRQQVLFLMQKTQKEANWNMDNDSDFQEDTSIDNRGNTVSVAGESTVNNLDQTDLLGMISSVDVDMGKLSDKKRHSSGGPNHYSRRNNQQLEYTGTREQVMTYNDKFEVQRELLRKSEIISNPMRFRLLAYSLTQFVPLRKNKYLERKRYVITDHQAQNLVCTCERMTGKRVGNQHQSYNCGEQCLNRVVSFECCPWSCPCGPFCKNRKFQLHQNAYVYPVKTEFKGWGLLAGEFIKKGSFIMQYVGEIFSVDSDLGKERVNMYKNSTCTYLMKTTANEVIDPTFQGNIARFINHSCDPNCVTQKWKVLGEICVGIFAKRDIKENEELTFDYQFDFFKTPFTRCYCGASKCKGYLGVLATNVSNSTLNPQISAPECNYCKNFITDKESLMLCKGPNKETYHIPCVIKKEGGNNKQRIQQFSKNLDSKNFICKICRLQDKRQGKNEIHDDSSSDVDMTTELATEPQYPWQCSNPDILRYYENNEENKTLDQIIKIEFDSLDKEFEQNSLKKRPQNMQKGADNFSNFYNFMSDLQKRLKQRIKHKKKQTGDGLIKFRRTKEMVFKNKFGDNNQPSSSKRGGRRTGRSAAQTRNNQSKSRQPAKPKRSQSNNIKPIQVEAQQDANSGPDQEILSSKDDDKPMSEKLVAQSFKALSDPQDYSSSKQLDDPVSEDEQADIELELDQESDDDEAIEQQEEEEEEVSEGEDEEEEAEEEAESENSEESQESISEEQEEEEEEESEEKRELNLEELQLSQESQQEEEERKSSSSSQSSQEDIKIKRKRAIKLISRKNQKREEYQPRRNSLIQQKSTSSSDEPSDQQNFLDKIQSEVAFQIDQFVKFQNSHAELKNEQSQVTKETKLNTYENVFNLAVLDYIEDYQCLPNFQIFWEHPWGGVVTLKIVSTFKQYQFFTQLLQSLTDQLLQKGMLRGFHQIQHYQVKEPPQQFPFEIIVIQVPKNFIRKIVGYQEKALNAYRKIYSVDFDFNKDLLSDDVFSLNETTQLRVFGNCRDARYVNEVIQKELEKLKMKTLFMQMSECKLIMDHVKEVKVQVDPCEIRVKKMIRDWKDLRHPFYYLPNYSREIVLIGSSLEIEMAERIIEKFFQIKREQQKINLQQICYLLPIQFKMNHQIIKMEMIKKYGPQNLQVYFYEPTFPRKHMTVLLIGDWKLLLEAKKTLQQEVDKYINPMSIEKNFEHFQQYTYHQQIRFSFKSLKRFVLEHDIKYLNHWDMVSTFIENMGSQREMMPVKGQIVVSEEIKRREEEHKADVQAFIKYIREDDVETCINSLFVLTESKPDILERLMKSFYLKKRDLIEMMMHVLKSNYQTYNDAMSYGGSKPFFKPFFAQSQIPYWQQNYSSQTFYKPPQNQAMTQNFELPQLPMASTQSEPQPLLLPPAPSLLSKSPSRSSTHNLYKPSSGYHGEDPDRYKTVGNKATSAENRFEKQSHTSSQEDHHRHHHRSGGYHHDEDGHRHRKYERSSSRHRHHHRRSTTSERRRRRERSNERYYEKYHRPREYHKSSRHYEDQYHHSRREEDPRKSHYHRKRSRSPSSSRSRSRYAKFTQNHPHQYEREESKYNSHHPQQQNFENLWPSVNEEIMNRQAHPHQLRDQQRQEDLQHRSPSQIHKSPPQIIQGQQKVPLGKPQQLPIMQGHIQHQQAMVQDNRMQSQAFYEQRSGEGQQTQQNYNPQSRSRDPRDPYYYEEHLRKRSRSRERRRSRESSHSRGRGRFQHYLSQRGHQHQENSYGHHYQQDKRRSRSRSLQARHYRDSQRDERHNYDRGRDTSYHQPSSYHREMYNHNSSQYQQDKRERSPPHLSRYEDYRMKQDESNYQRAHHIETQGHLQRPQSSSMNRPSLDEPQQYQNHHYMRHNDNQANFSGVSNQNKQ